MGSLTDLLRKTGRKSAIPSSDGSGVGQIDEREQAIIDRHASEALKSSLFQKKARRDAQKEIDARKQQRAYAEQAPPEVSGPVKEMLSNLDDRTKVRSIYQKLTPEQRQEALNLVPGISQQLGDDRGGALSRVGGALRRGVSAISQPAVELADKVIGTDWGGTPEEIAFIRQMEAAKAQEFAPALPSDPWYERFPLQALEMVPFSAATIGGGAIGGVVGKAGGNLLAKGAAAGVPGARGVAQAAGAVGRIPTAVGLPAMTAQGVGTVAGITAVGFPGQYAQEIDQLKELGVEDGPAMQSLAVGTALVSSALEAIMPNPFKGVLPAGKVSIQDGALKAARQYLWEAAKRFPAELSEEYAQGLSSGLGKVVASHLDMTTQDATFGDAFAMSFEQGNAAIGPMAFLLGVPAAGGAAYTAFRARGGTPPGPPPPAVAPPAGGQSDVASDVMSPGEQVVVVPPTTAAQDPQQRLASLLAIQSKGPVSRKDARKLGIVFDPADNLEPRRTAEVKRLIDELQQQLGVAQPQQQQPPPQGVPDETQVQPNEESTVQGQARVQGEQEARIEGDEQQAVQGASAQEVPVGTSEGSPVTAPQIQTGTRHGGTAESKEYMDKGGWKLHLAVAPENYAAVDEWLDKNHPGQYKHLFGGEPGESDFTAYVGDRKVANDLARRMEVEIGDKLLPSTKSGGSDTLFSPKVSGRFDSRVRKHGSVGDKYSYYGRDGIPYDKEAKEAELQVMLHEQSGNVKASAQWRKILEGHERRMQRELKAEYGERFEVSQVAPAQEVPEATSETAPVSAVSQPPVSDVDSVKTAMASAPIGVGGNARVYGIDDARVVRVPKNVKDVTGEFTPVEHPLTKRGLRVGQAIAKNEQGVEILQRQSGSEAGLALPSGNQAQDDAQYARAIQDAASLSQEAYDEFADTLKALDESGYQFDPSKSNNVLIDTKAGKFNLVDVNESKSGKPQASLEYMLIPLIGNTYAHKFKGESLEAPRKEIARKATEAARKAGINLELGSSGKYSLELAGEVADVAQPPVTPEPKKRRGKTAEKWQKLRPQDKPTGEQDTGTERELSGNRAGTDETTSGDLSPIGDKKPAEAASSPTTTAEQKPAAEAQPDRVQQLQDSFPLNREQAIAADILMDSMALPREVEIAPKGTPIPDAETLFQKDTPRWHSKARALINEKMGPKASPQQVLNMLKKNGVKEEELQWSGLEELLGGEKSLKSVTKEEVLAALDNGFELKEVVLPDSKAIPKFENVVDHAGRSLIHRKEQNKFQVVISRLNESSRGSGNFFGDTLEEAMDKARTEWDKVSPTLYEYQATQPKFGQYTLPGGEGYQEMVFTTGDDYESSHYPGIKGYNGHMRWNERVDADGKRVMFLEEIQNDRHQAGRKKGYGPQTEPHVEAYYVVPKTGEKVPIGFGKTEAEAAQSIDPGWEQVLESIGQKPQFSTTQRKIGEGVPDAPFKKTWHMLAMKRAIQYAAENGFDRIAWTTGEQQAERYDLSKQVDYLLAKKNADGTFQVSAQVQGRGNMLGSNLTEAELEDHVGKEIAKKIANSEGEDINLGGNGSVSQPKDIWKKLSGDNLKVGGEGMKAFYDKMLPNEVNKFIKKFGAKVGQTQLRKLTAGGGRKVGGTLQPSFDITPAMRESALANGQPLFQKQRDQQGTIQAWTHFVNASKALVGATSEADVSSFFHEIGHPMRKFLFNREVSQEERGNITDADIDYMEEFLGVENGNWNRDNEELFVDALMKYWREGKHPNKQVESIFQKISAWLSKVLSVLERDIELDDRVREIFDRVHLRGGIDPKKLQALKEAEATAEEVMTDEPTVAEEAADLVGDIFGLQTDETDKQLADAGITITRTKKKAWSVKGISDEQFEAIRKDFDGKRAGKGGSYIFQKDPTQGLLGAAEENARESQLDAEAAERGLVRTRIAEIEKRDAYARAKAARKDGPTSKGKQKPLFDTSGDKDQMTFLDDGITPEDRVYRPESGESDTLFQAQKSDKRLVAELAKKFIDEGGETFDGYVKHVAKKMTKEQALDLSEYLEEIWKQIRKLKAYSHLPEAGSVADVLSEKPKKKKKKPVNPEPSGEGGETTGTKHAKTDELRAKYGLPERVLPTPETFEEWEEAARRKYPDAAARLRAVELAERNPERVDKIENAAIGQHIVYLNNRLDAGEDVLDELLRTIKASTVAGTEAGRALVSRKAERYGDFSLAGLIKEHLGTVGKDPTDKQMQEYAELADRIKQLESEKLDLAKKLTQEAIARKKAEAAAVTKPKPVQDKKGTKREVLQKKASAAVEAFKNVWNKLYGSDDKTTLYQAVRDDSWDRITKAAGDVIKSYAELGVDFFLELMASVGRDIGKLNSEQVEAFNEAWESHKRDTKVESPLGENPENAAIGARAKELMAFAIEAGYGAKPETWMEVVNAVHSQLSLEVPGISEYETMQAMSDYGVWRPLNKEEVAVTTRAIRGKVRQSLKIEDTIKAIKQSKAWLAEDVSPEEVARRLRDQGLLPKATGREQATPDSIERELLAQFNKLKKDLPVSAESKEGQLKSALTTAKTAGRNRLELLDKDIKALEEAIDKPKELAKPVDERTPLKTDPELVAIRKQLEDKRKRRAELKAQYETIFPPTKKQRLVTAEQQTQRALEAIKKLQERLQQVKEGKDTDTKKKPSLVAAEVQAQLNMWQERLRAAKQAAKEAELARYEGEGGAALPPTGRKQLTDEQRLAMSERMLKEQIDAVKADLKALESGTWVPAIKGEVPTSETRKALRAELTALRDIQKQARKASPVYQALEEAKYWERYRKTQEKRLAFWEKRRDEAVAGRLPVPFEKRTITEDAILDKNLEIEKVQYEAMHAMEKANRATWNAGQWIGQGVLEVTSLIPKSLMLGLELSFFSRQGFFYGRSHPIKAFMAAVEAIPAVFSQRLALASMERIESRGNAREYHPAKVDFTQVHGPQAKLEEMFQSSLIQWLDNTEGKLFLPLRTLAKAYSMLERGNRTFSNIMKADLYDIQKRDTLAVREFFGQSTVWTENDIKQAGRTANIFSGRGTGLKGGSPWLDFVFLARRWAWSRIQADFIVPFQLVTPQWIGQWNADRGMRVAMAKLYLQTLMGHATKMAIAYWVYSILAGDDEEKKPTIEFDPRSSDAWALKLGETRIKDEGGLMPAIVLASRIATGTTKTSKGELKSIYGEDVPWGGQDAADYAINFARYKLGTGPSSILEWMSGKDAIGKPVTVTGAVVSRFTPLTWWEIAKAEEELGVAQGTVAALEAFFGASVTTYGPRTKYRESTGSERQEQMEKDLENLEWDAPNPSYSEFLTKEQLDQFEKRRANRVGLKLSQAISDPESELGKKTRDKALELIKQSKRLGRTRAEAIKAYTDYWQENNKKNGKKASTHEIVDGSRVMKAALRKGINKVKALYRD